MEKLNCIWVSERGQSEKAINCLIPVTRHRKAETTMTVEDQCLPGTWRGAQGTCMKLLPGESQERGSLMGCRLWGLTESYTTDVT